MSLSWNEIKTRAVEFSKEWENETSEDAEAQTFWNEFFNIFGITRRRVASFEKRVTKGARKNGKIDMLWKGQLLVEHKSAGKDLSRAYKQAVDYFPGLEEHELPKYIIVCNFQKFKIYDLEENTKNEFDLKELVRNVKHFGFIAGYQKKVYKEEDPVNIEAAVLMGKLHDRLKGVGYVGHNLEVYLVRLLFCLFADDTSIFERGIFQDYIEQKTNKDGSDLAYHIKAIFNILNIPREKRLTNIDEDLNAFPFVNGKLFKESLSMASFDSEMRNTLLECCILDWSKISPAIFGSLFQSVMYEEERRHLGAHYTSEKNILKLIKPLFLDELWEEFEKVKSNSKKLIEFHNKIARLRFLDPGCGCGNFLIITYRELRLLEIEIIKKLFKDQQVTEISSLIKIDIDHFYGIEIEEFPAQISQVAMWLIDHQMNMIVSEEFGEYFIRLPLLKSANIINNDALKIEWDELIDKNVRVNNNNNYFDYIFSNPPYAGSKLMSDKQRCDIKELFNGIDNSGVLDYVSGWYMKAAKYIQNKSTKVGYVSTNSINQGEQVGPIWNTMFDKYKIKIHFAHQTFKWSNEARGVAAVYCVIIGFANYDSDNKQLFEYDTVKSEPHVRKVKNINSYLVDGSDFALLKRYNPLCDVPKMSFGNMPLDGGNLLLTDSEKIELLKKEPKAERFIKPLISAKEYLRNEKRWCIWLVDAMPKDIKDMPEIINRIKKVKAFRLNSVAPSTQKHAFTPSLFRDRNNPDYSIVIPRVSSENRKYIPIGFFDKNSIIGDTCMHIPNGKIYHFGILISEMHMSWIKYTCGKLEGRYRYSKDIVYNNYPFPENQTDEKVKRIEEKSQKVLDVRKEYHESSLADLYDPNCMPPKLVKAHQQLNKAVDRCYRTKPFTSNTSRLEFLFELYNKYASPLIATDKKINKKKRKA